jgi:hypothetical protein
MGPAEGSDLGDIGPVRESHSQAIWLILKPSDELCPFKRRNQQRTSCYARRCWFRQEVVDGKVSWNIWELPSKCSSNAHAFNLNELF